MEDDDEMVTVLKSSDASYVASVVSMLEAEGIAVHHPGLNHAGMLPGLTYIEIPVRVPKSRVADAMALLAGTAVDNAATATATEGRAGPDVFRVKRTRTVLGVMLGWLAAIGVLIASRVVSTGFNGSVALIILGLGVAAGYVLGSSSRRDICSGPSCGAHLPNDALRCPKCAGTVRGEIKSATEHFAALETLRPERDVVEAGAAEP